MVLIPDDITHNNDPVRGIAKNLCNLPVDRAERVLEDIRSSGKRKIRPNHLKRWLNIEEWLVAERRKKCGQGVLSAGCGQFQNKSMLIKREKIVLHQAFFA